MVSSQARYQSHWDNMSSALVAYIYIIHISLGGDDTQEIMEIGLSGFSGTTVLLEQLLASERGPGLIMNCVFLGYEMLYMLL